MELNNNCINCGNKNDNNSRYCVQCGETLENQTIQANTIHTPPLNDLSTSNAQSKRPIRGANQKSRKKLIAAVLSAGIILVGGVGVYYLSNNNSDDSAIVAELKEAAKDNDYEALLGLINFDQVNFYDKSVYINYLQSFGIDKISEALQSEIHKIQDENKTDQLYKVLINDVELFELKKDEKKNDITLYPHTITFNAVTEYVGTKLVVGAEELDLNEEITSIGNIIPGTYTAKLTGMMEDFEINEEFELQIEADTKEIEINPSTYAITYDSDYDNTSISIDGRVIDPVAGEYVPLVIPVGNEVEVFGVVQYNGTKYESEKAKISKDTAIKFTFPHLDQLIAKENEKGRLSLEHLPASFPSDKSEQQIFVWQAASEIIPSFLHVYQNGETDLLAKYVYKQSPFYTSHLNVMKENEKNGTVVELLWVTIENIEMLEGNKFTVTTQEEFKVTLKGKDPTNTSQSAKYTVQYVNGQLYITDLNL